MLSYSYTLTYVLHGQFSRLRVPSEEEMFSFALVLDEQGAELRSAVRETWEEVDGWAYPLRVQSYRMGVLQ